MRPRVRHSKRSSPPSRGLLEQTWLTYVLSILVIILIVAFYASMRYQDEIIAFFKGLLNRSQKPMPPPKLLWQPAATSTPLHLMS